MRLTETFEDLLDTDVAEEVRRRGGNVVRAARGIPPVAVAQTASRRLAGIGLFAGGLVAGLGIGFLARRLSTTVPETYQPHPSYPVKDGLVDLTGVAEQDGLVTSEPTGTR